MRMIILLFALLGLTQCRPQAQFFKAPLEAAKAFITSFENTNNGLGEYSYNVETSDGQKRGERRYVVNPGSPNEEAVVEGFYSYGGDDGKEYVVGYIADKGGFQPEGTHIPPAADVKRRPPQVGVTFRFETGSPHIGLHIISTSQGNAELKTIQKAAILTLTGGMGK